MSDLKKKKEKRRLSERRPRAGGEESETGERSAFSLSPTLAASGSPLLSTVRGTALAWYA